jgi:hypothetical protein
MSEGARSWDSTTQSKSDARRGRLLAFESSQFESLSFFARFERCDPAPELVGAEIVSLER